MENEPHPMQRTCPKGEPIFAGALFGAGTHAFGATQIPSPRLRGPSLPAQTRGGSVPDAYRTLKDCTAYGDVHGRPVVPGPYNLQRRLNPHQQRFHR